MASDASVSELAPPGTKVAIGIDVQGLLHSPLLKELAGQEQELAAKLVASHNLAGFDPLKDVDQVLILSTGAAGQGSTLIVARGRFDAEQLAKDAKRYHEIPVIEIGKDGGSIALIDSETAIVGDRTQVEAAIDRRGSGAQLDGDLMSRIDAARSQYDVWGMGDCPDGLPATGEGAEALRAIDHFAFGAALRDGLELTAQVHTRSPEDAAKMTVVLGMIESMLKAQQPKDGGLKFDLQSDNGTFRVALSVPEEELHKAIANQRTTVVAALSKRIQGDGPKLELDTLPESSPIAAPDAAFPVLADPPALPVLDAMIPPAPSVAAMPPEAETNAAPPKAKLPVKPETKAEIVKAPNGDTLFLKLPGAK